MNTMRETIARSLCDIDDETYEPNLHLYLERADAALAAMSTLTPPMLEAAALVHDRHPDHEIRDGSIRCSGCAWAKHGGSYADWRDHITTTTWHALLETTGATS